MNGNMLEAKIRRVDWSDIDEDTFVRLCEYAYLHDYTPPSPLEISVCAKTMWGGSAEHVVDEQPPTSAPEPEPVPVPEPELDAWSSFGSLSPKKKKPKEKTCKNPTVSSSLLKAKPASPVVKEPLPYKEKSIWTRHLQDSFLSLALDATNNSTNQAQEDRFSPEGNTQNQDFTPVFLGHARLYLLAHKYMIDSLRQLALSKMTQTLSEFTLYRQSLPAVIEFVRFVYAETDRFGFATAPLRTLVTSYVVSALGQLGDDKRFEALLEGGGDFVSDFWRAVWKAE